MLLAAPALGQCVTADLAVTIDGPATASQGQSITYHATVKNNGPCDATNVFVDLIGDPVLAFVSATGVCSGGFPGGECAFNPITLAVNATASFDVTLQFGSLPSDVYSGAVTAALEAGSDLTDPVGDNNSAATMATWSKSSGGCSSTGDAGSAIGLVSLLGFAIRRRWLS
jgi:uncharacterized repeat protein (TIGR01451 family)/uncharacterized protein (TIGR03382 family)